MASTPQVESQVITFVESHFGEKIDIQDRLMGGSANYVYRIKAPDGNTYIVRHAEAFIKTNPGFSFPTQRLDFEANILERLPSVLPSDEFVKPVKLIKYDSENHNLLLSDGGPRTLKAAYSGPELDIKLIGGHLGIWLARFHKATKDLPFEDHQLAKSIYRYSYNNLASALKAYGLDHNFGEIINRDFGALLVTDEGSMCHGDFWPGNVIVKTDPVEVTIVDWEITRRGNGVTDVGQFAAESWLLDRFWGDRGLLDSFLEGYVKEMGEMSLSNLQRVVIHFGTHISFWPTVVRWADQAETAKVVRTGYEFLQRGNAMDWDWLRQSDLRKLFVRA